MRSNHPTGLDRLDPVPMWADNLRMELVAPFASEWAHDIAAGAAGVVSSLSLATAAGAATYQGGTTMSTVIGAAAASHTTMKIAAGSLAAALAAGGAAVATGHLSLDTGSEGTVGVNTVVVEDARADLRIETIALEGLGTVEVGVDGSTLQVLDLRGAAGVAAHIQSQSQGSAEIDFTRDGETRTLLITLVSGEIATSITSSATSDSGTDSEDSPGATTDVDVDVSIGARIGIGDDG